MVHAQSPALEVGEDPVNPHQNLVSFPVANHSVLPRIVGQAGVAAPAIGDHPRIRRDRPGNEAAKRSGSIIPNCPKPNAARLTALRQFHRPSHEDTPRSTAPPAGDVFRAVAIPKGHGRQARIRRDWHHKATKTIAGRFGTVVLEKLNTKGMTASAKGTVENPGRMVGQKASLNRSILNQGWVAFETILAYKLKDCGGYLFKVDPRDTSQTCSACGVVDRQSRESQAHFACSHCGHRTNADVNVALNILKRNTASEHGVAGHGGLSFVPREVSTEQAHQGLEILGL